MSKEPMLNIRWKSVLRPLHIWTVCSVFILDQITKFLVVQWMPVGHRIPLLDPYLNLVHTKNKGAAFGIFHETTPIFRILFFGAVTLVCVYLLLNWLSTATQQEKLSRFSLSLILGGAFGNLLDRVVFGQVTDFVDCYFSWWDYHFAAFNVADSAISVGVALIFLNLLKPKKA
jgi:signal peptidase II